MSKYDFELTEFQQRQAKVRKAMEQQGIELLLVIHPVNLNYLIGWRGKAYQEFQVLFFPIEPGPLVFLTRISEVPEAQDLTLADEVYGWASWGYGSRKPEEPVDAFKRIMSEKKYLGRRIGLEVPDYYLAPHQYIKIKEILGESLVTEATHLVEDVKMVKSPAELAYIRKAAYIADKAMETCVEAIVEGKTELEVVGEMHRTLMALGSDTPASPMNFVSGERTAYPHGMPTERKLRKGDFIHNEYGAAYRRYTTTIGRVMCLGQPTNRMMEIYQAVRDACDSAIGEIKHGVPAPLPHQAAKKWIEKAGLGQYRLHLTGYGLAPGFPPMWLEAVEMEDGNPYTLEAGMVVSIEPPVHIHQEKLGARIIDNVLVKESGAEILSKFSRDLIVL